ncbi:hypothetical protein H310_08456 [Aphanomyces invadans]|uniref:Uncharacterized protein n=1 Tax=Aphanomyces invadans TaxID=157072 RepID=A0A024TYA2_9STRA|nr:hypothetical protein H310_08456 [Aphanomyces invadans]ETV98983.1 hypothetical protein H310_08456 [Aphanomyces invadans]|eukprot:XP_008872411.1 hypothetical protein H310_08456 [Aphanomyces invadans]
MDDKELDADRCYDKWVYSYWSLLERNNMMSFHTKHPKAAVKALVEGLRPPALKAVIKSHLDLDQKHLRNSVLQFMAYVKVKLVAQLEFTRAAKVSGIVKTLGDQSSRAGSLAPRNVKALKKAPSCWACRGNHRIEACAEVSDAEKKAIRDKRKGE